MYADEVFDGGGLLSRLDVDGYWERNPAGVMVKVRDLTPDEAERVGGGADLVACRTALADALALLPSMPLPDPDQQAQAQAQVDAALTAYRALETPPADVVDLANKVSTHLQSNAYKRSLEARAAYQAGDALFLADPTVTLPQLIAQVRALTAQLAVVRDA